MLSSGGFSHNQTVVESPSFETDSSESETSDDVDIFHMGKHESNRRNESQRQVSFKD